MGINYFSYFENKSDSFRFALFDLNKKQIKKAYFHLTDLDPKNRNPYQSNFFF